LAQTALCLGFVQLQHGQNGPLTEPRGPLPPYR